MIVDRQKLEEFRNENGSADNSKGQTVHQDTAIQAVASIHPTLQDVLPVEIYQPFGSDPEQSTQFCLQRHTVPGLGSLGLLVPAVMWFQHLGP